MLQNRPLGAYFARVHASCSSHAAAYHSCPCSLPPHPNPSAGFNFVEEGPKKKKGYVGTTPRSFITFKLNTSRTSDTAATVIVQLAHLRSYEHMGIGVATCVAGCSCPEKRIDGHHNTSESQTYLATLQVTQSPDCQVKVGGGRTWLEGGEGSQESSRCGENSKRRPQGGAGRTGGQGGGRSFCPQSSPLACAQLSVIPTPHLAGDHYP